MSQILIAHISVTAEPILMKIEAKNYQLKATHHAKLYLELTTWVVWENTQFATVRILSLFLFFFWFLSYAHMSHQWIEFYDLYIIRCSMQGCAFWGLR